MVELTLAENEAPINASGITSANKAQQSRAHACDVGSRRLIETGFSTLMLLVIVFGVALDCVDWNWPIPNPQLWKFSFYTIQSNSVLGLYYFRSIRASRQEHHLLKPCALMMITITGVVWHIILRGLVDLSQYTVKTLIASHVLHTITPVMAWLDWLLLGKKGVMKKRYTPVFLLCPLAYLTFSLIRAYAGGPLGISPRTSAPFYHWYRFIESSDPLRIFPWAGLDHAPRLVVVVNCLVLASAMLTFGLGFVALDKALAAVERRVLKGG